MMAEQIWLMKSEPDAYSIQKLKVDKKTWWEGVRNYQARNFMTQAMQIGDHVLFYHSNAEPPGIAGLARVCALAKPDQSQFDKKSDHFDPKATIEKPNWFCVQVEFVKIFPHFISLAELKTNSQLQTLLVLRKGQRLSIQPVTASEYKIILKLGATNG